MSEYAQPCYSDVSIGTSLGELVVDIGRVDLIRYAGASLDFNPIHWSDQAAAQAGLPDVIAHGMLTMALAARLITRWAGDPGAVRAYSVRFSAVVPVPVDRTTSVVTSGKVAEKLEECHVAVALTVTCDGREVLKNATALVCLPR